MGSEPFVIINPKGNNRDLIVECRSQSGDRTIRLAFLKPGQSYRPEKENITVRSVRRPLLLDTTQVEGIFVVKEVATAANSR